MKLARNIAIFISPLLFIVGVNSLIENDLAESKDANPEYCTWHCHNNTDYCRMHHVTFLKDHFDKTDPIYFGIITLLKSTGNYALYNLLILGFIVPIVIYFLFIRLLNRWFP